MSDESLYVVLDDPDGQRRYGIEPFERTDLLTESPEALIQIAQRIMRNRAPSTAPRVRSVSLDAGTSDAALDLMTTVDLFVPSRYRCRLELDRGLVFDGEYFATGVAFEVTRSSWTLELNLDSAAPYEVNGGSWDDAHWDEDVWAAPAGTAGREPT